MGDVGGQADDDRSVISSSPSDGNQCGVFSGNQCGVFSGNQCGVSSGNQCGVFSGNQCGVFSGNQCGVSGRQTRSLLLFPRRLEQCRTFARETSMSLRTERNADDAISVSSHESFHSARSVFDLHRR